MLDKCSTTELRPATPFPDSDFQAWVFNTDGSNLSLSSHVVHALCLV
jgi:hypothetical protein